MRLLRWLRTEHDVSVHGWFIVVVVYWAVSAVVEWVVDTARWLF